MSKNKAAQRQLIWLRNMIPAFIAITVFAISNNILSKALLLCSLLAAFFLYVFDQRSNITIANRFSIFWLVFALLFILHIYLLLDNVLPGIYVVFFVFFYFSITNLIIHFGDKLKESKGSDSN